MMLLIELYVIGVLAMMLTLYCFAYAKHTYVAFMGFPFLVVAIICLFTADHIRILP